jgi:hypothetical protein
MDIVADNYRVGAIADFVLTVVSYKSTVVLKRTQPTTTTTTDGTTDGTTTTTSKVGVVVDRGSTTHDYDTQSIPHDRVPPSDSNVMRKIRHTRERHYATVVQLDKDHKDTLSSSLSSSLSASLSSSLPATTAASTSSAYHAPHATLDKSLEFWANKNNTTTTTTTTSSGGGGLPSYTTVVKQAKTHADEPGGLPPPPPYTRVVVSPEKAALRAKIQQQLMEQSSSSSSSSSALTDYHGAVVDVEDQECAVVYRGGLLMPTIDMSPSSKLNGTYVFYYCVFRQYFCPTH